MAKNIGMSMGKRACLVFVTVLLCVTGFFLSVVCASETLIVVTQDGVDEQGNFFTLEPTCDLSLALHHVQGVNDKGELILGKAADTQILKKGESFSFRCMVTESLPTLCVVVQAHGKKAQWCPAISGMDGSLILAPFFKEK